jgi:hypothetical protein
VEDILRRLGNVETDVSELKSQVGAIQATMPHMATKADVKDVRTAVAELRAEMFAAMGSLRAEMSAGIGSLRAEMLTGIGSLRAEMLTGIGSLRAELSARDTTMIKWLIGTMFTAVGLSLAIAKFVH